MVERLTSGVTRNPARPRDQAVREGVGRAHGK